MRVCIDLAILLHMTAAYLGHLLMVLNLQQTSSSLWGREYPQLLMPRCSSSLKDTLDLIHHQLVRVCLSHQDRGNLYHTDD